MYIVARYTSYLVVRFPAYCSRGTRVYPFPGLTLAGLRLMHLGARGHADTWPVRTADQDAGHDPSRCRRS
jgi:hypothetical protein